MLEDLQAAVAEAMAGNVLAGACAARPPQAGHTAGSGDRSDDRAAAMSAAAAAQQQQACLQM